MIYFFDYLGETLDILGPANSASQTCLRELRHVRRQEDATNVECAFVSNFEYWSLVCCLPVQESVSNIFGYTSETDRKRKWEYRTLLFCKRWCPLRMPGRGLTEYLTANPEKNRLDLLYDIAQDLEHLHSHAVAHGDLREQDIFVDDAGHARIAGLDLITTTSNLEPTLSSAKAPAIGLAAPEVLGGDTSITKEADIFSFGMVMIEAFTGAAPFSHHPPTAVAVGILAGKRPERPGHSGLTDELWYLGRCWWDQEPQLRPGISEVVSCLQSALAVQGGHEDGTGVLTTDYERSKSSQRRESSHHASLLPHFPHGRVSVLKD